MPRASYHALTTPAPPRSDDNVNTAMSCGANALDKAASDGISATQGWHQVAQKFTIMPLPRNSAKRCSPPSASRNTPSGGA